MGPAPTYNPYNTGPRRYTPQTPSREGGDRFHNLNESPLEPIPAMVIQRTDGRLSPRPSNEYLSHNSSSMHPQHLQPFSDETVPPSRTIEIDDYYTNNSDHDLSYMGYDYSSERLTPVHRETEWTQNPFSTEQDNRQLLAITNASRTNDSLNRKSEYDYESQAPRRQASVLRYFDNREGDDFAQEMDEMGGETIPIEGDEYMLNSWETGDSVHQTDAEDESQEKPAAGPRRVKLFRGNLVLDCPVSNALLSQYPEHQPVREFTHMRYSAATCDPLNFSQDGFILRQMCYSQPRQTELCIAITIYNEDDILLARTLQGVFNNIRYLCGKSRSKTWGADAWKKIVVCVIADGREKLNPRAKALMAAFGVYQEGFAKNAVDGKEVHGHIYEYTTMVRVAEVSDTVRLTTQKATPVQMLFCLKEKNKKKINSHRWFFQAFGQILRPKVCVLLDAGTRPGNHAIYHLWKAFDKNPRVAGACGEIAAAAGRGYNKLLNPVVAAQNFEYKMSNILDKPSESVFGFISVLPGAFSAYRYDALQNDALGQGPLEKYFKGEKLEGEGGVFQANMYLAEDRILCWELVSKRDCNWLLKYVKSAKAHTDVPEGLSELILQRRRWLNGSFFASIYAQAHMYQIWRSSHSFIRKLMFHVQFIYQTFSLLFSWFSLANFFLVFKILTSALGDSSAGFAPGQILSIVLTWVYAACILCIFILSFGNRPKGTRWFYNAVVTFFAGLMAYIMFAAIYIAVKSIQYAICSNNGFEAKLLVTNKTFRDLLISLLSTYALYLLASLLFLEPFHMVTSFLQYLLLSPAYINVFNVYAFCNTHDISWGTKGDTTMNTDLGVVSADDSGKVEVDLPTNMDIVESQYVKEVHVLGEPPIPVKETRSESEQRTDYYALFRSSVVIAWGITNIALVAVVLNVAGFQVLTKPNAQPAVPNAQVAGNPAALSVAHTVAERSIELFSRATCHEIKTTSTETTSIYLAVVLWSVAGMAAYRFICCSLYLVKWILGH